MPKQYGQFRALGNESIAAVAQCGMVRRRGSSSGGLSPAKAHEKEEPRRPYKQNFCFVFLLLLCSLPFLFGLNDNNNNNGRDAALLHRRLLAFTVWVLSRVLCKYYNQSIR